VGPGEGRDIEFAVCFILRLSDYTQLPDREFFLCLFRPIVTARFSFPLAKIADALTRRQKQNSTSYHLRKTEKKQQQQHQQ
jgi:hypothetical protein